LAAWLKQPPWLDRGDRHWAHLFPFGLLHAMRDPDDAARIVRDAAAEASECVESEGVQDAPDESPAKEGGSVVSAAPGMKLCPMCAEEVRAAALICRFCRYDFAQS
jgi:hypothetical protein